MQLRIPYSKALVCSAFLAMIISMALIFFHLRPKGYQLINDTYYAQTYVETLRISLSHHSHHAPQHLSQNLLEQFKEVEAVEMRLNNQFVYQVQPTFYKPVTILRLASLAQDDCGEGNIAQNKQKEVNKKFGHPERGQMAESKDHPYIAEVNDQKNILLENGILVPENIFAQPPSLPNICIKSSIDQSMGKKIAQWAQDNATTLLSKYAATWIEPTKIILKPHQEENYLLVVRHDQLITSQLLGTCKQIIKQIEEESSKKIIKGELFIADLRFKDQIIIAKKKGDYEGEII